MGGCCLCAWGEPALPLVSKANSEEEELVIELGGAKTSWNRPAPLYPSFSAFQTMTFRDCWSLFLLPSKSHAYFSLAKSKLELRK